MIHKFHSRPNGWEGITPHIYKENPGVFRDVTKQILFDNEADLPVQFRYFQVEKDGFSSLEKHEHMHLVLIFKGKGHALLGSDVHEVREGYLFFRSIFSVSSLAFVSTSFASGNTSRHR